jgi:hypothetical protein
VQLTLLCVGPESVADQLEAAIEPVDGYVEHLASADQIQGAFIHVAAGGLHH